jgi:hypothetical protein
MRTPSVELHSGAVEALLDALREAGLQADRSPRADLTVEGPTGALLVEVKAASVLDAGRARAQLEAWAGARAGSEKPSGTMLVLVADQLSEAARELLRHSDCGYLDRRGALWLRAPGLFVNDTGLSPLARRSRRHDEPIRGRVAMGVALRRLMRPEATESVREIAAVLGASASTVHAALATLREAALLDAAGEPLLPDLFDAVAAVWRPERVPVRRPPDTGDVELELGWHEDESGSRDTPGWVVSGDVGAAAAGAPLLLSAAAPPDFYVPTEAVLRRAIRRLGQCSYDERGATLALAPSRLVTMERYGATSGQFEWPVAHPVVIALDLAQDLARGREIVDEWTPEGFRRVW